jgi:GT2 family glycosyltransferase
MMVRSGAWTRCGGLDDDFFAHMEEIDLCWRFHLAGFRVSFIPDSVVYHIGGGVLPYDSGHKTYLNFRNNLYMLYKNLQTINYTVLFDNKILDRWRPFNHRTECKAVWNAHIDYYRNIKSLRVKRRSVRNLMISQPGSLLLNKCIVFRFYIKGDKTFSSLNIQN